MLTRLERWRDAEQILTALARRADLVGTYRLLATIGDAPAEQRIAARVRELAHARHGAAVDTLVAALAYEAEASRFMALRSRVTDADLRYFLAVLLVVPTAAAVRRLICARLPTQDYATTVIGWLTTLAEMHAFKYRLDEVQLQLIELMLRGQSFTKCLQQFARDYGRAETMAQKAELRQLYDQIKVMPYLDRLVAAAG